MDVKWGVSLPSLKLILFFSTRSKRVLKTWIVSNPVINSEGNGRTYSALHYLESDTTSYVSVIIWWTRVLWIEQKEEDIIHVSVISWRIVAERRCLFVREEWSEYLLWLWRHSCTGMRNSWDTHRWDWVCLNIIHSGWEPLSRVMWWG